MARPYQEIKACRICGNKDLRLILSLGRQALTGVFPKERTKIVSGPLELVRCATRRGGETCGLVQLRHSYDTGLLYGKGYGYHSNLNRSMVEHLRAKVRKILSLVSVGRGDLILDIGSNDSTLLRGYPEDKGLTLVGIDPTGPVFSKYYPPHIDLIGDFFSAAAVRGRFGERKAKVVTSISMFYDLESPMEFVAQIRAVLADDGVWILEQNYLPTMLELTAYDTVCHEHLEYYGLSQIKWMTDRVGLKIIDVETSAVNGGSFSITVAKETAPYACQTRRIESFLNKERPLFGAAPYASFSRRVSRHRENFLRILSRARRQKKTVVGLGASTKGNVILQFCGLTSREIPMIGEVNEDKFGCVTPGSRIPIVPEAFAHALRPDYFLVLPWHFKEFFMRKERDYLRSGGQLLFPLPML